MQTALILNTWQMATAGTVETARRKDVFSTIGDMPSLVETEAIQLLWLDSHVYRV